MSYILDALRRADAEREREAGGVPTLQSQARASLPDDDDDRPPPAARPAWLLPAAGGAVLALAGAWLLLRGGSDTPAVAPVPMAAAPQAKAMDAVPPAPTPLPTPPRAEPASPPVVVAPPSAQVAPQAAAPAPVPRQMPERPAPAAAVAPPTNPPAVTAARPAAPPAPLPERVPRLAELPDSLRRELPALAVGGSIHSPDPSARMVILNGQVQREGDTVGNGLVLKRIRATSAVFEYRGQIFEMPF